MSDARFSLDWEDADLCFRVHRAGYKLRIVNTSPVRHLASQTTKRFRPMVAYYSLRNRAWVVRRHGGMKRRILFGLYNFGYRYPRTILGRLRRGSSNVSGPHCEASGTDT